jgi:hypothetical protein
MVAHALHEEGIVDPVIGKLVDGIGMHARACRESLGQATAWWRKSSSRTSAWCDI